MQMQMQMQAAGWGVTHRVQQLYLDLHAVQELLHVSRQGPGGPRPTAQDQDLRGGADELQEGQAVHRDLGQRAWPPQHVHVCVRQHGAGHLHVVDVEPPCEIPAAGVATCANRVVS